MTRYDVFCPFCGQAHLETTDQFDPAIPANGNMLDLKEPFKSFGWTGPAKDEQIQYANIVCPSCGDDAVLTDSSGKLIDIREQKPFAETVCEICGEGFKNGRALAGHMKVHNREMFQQVVNG